MVLHVPEEHQASIIARERAGWLRCRLVESLPDQPTYTAPPRVNAITAFTIGGTAPMANAEVLHRETLGISDGTPGQRFPLLRRPVLASLAAGTLEVQTPEGEQIWTEVRQFAESGPGRPALPPRPRGRRGAVRPGGPARRRDAAHTTAPCRPAARRCC